MHFDPALQKYAKLNTNRYRFFRWNPRTAKLTFWYVFLVPSFIGSLAYWSEGRYEFRGKRRGDVASEF
ncbi:hypothetical protein RUND412_009630 [Rhizina undulata]